VGAILIPLSDTSAALWEPPAFFKNGKDLLFKM